MRDLPGEIQEAATIDGAGTAQIFTKVMLPLTRPALAALGRCPSPGSSTTCSGRSPCCGPTTTCRSPRRCSPSRDSSSRPGTSSPPVLSSRQSPPSRSSCASSGTSSPAWRWERSSDRRVRQRWTLRGTHTEYTVRMPEHGRWLELVAWVRTASPTGRRRSPTTARCRS
ncbi:hypothetical protein NKG94_31825 [Micromonospora sp. M12]